MDWKSKTRKTKSNQTVIFKNNDMESIKKPKQTSILLEVVDNGFIVKEDFHEFAHHQNPTARINDKKVFNTKKQLYNYIADNL